MSEMYHNLRKQPPLLEVVMKSSMVYGRPCQVKYLFGTGDYWNDYFFHGWIHREDGVYAILETQQGQMTTALVYPTVQDNSGRYYALEFKDRKFGEIVT